MLVSNTTRLSKALRKTTRCTLAAALFCCLAHVVLAQSAPEVTAPDAPLISGGAGFLTSSKGGNTTYTPLIEPLLAVPLGSRLLVESRAALVEIVSPDGHGGYSHSHFIGLTYLSGDYFASPHATVVVGDFLLPFNTYNERLSPLWIGNFQDAPLTINLGLFSTGTGLGGMVRGSAISRSRYSMDYATWFSARSGNSQFTAQRSFGGRASIYLPESRLEGGLSYARSLQGPLHENFYGGHLWWDSKDAALRLRSEYSRGHYAQGYWAEADYRTLALGGADNWRGRFEPLFRMQQTFRRNNAASDGLPMVNTQRADFGLDYNLPHNARILTSYSRQFSSSGDQNIWETGIVYRLLFPAWK
jgi:hypothetical protein